MSEKLKILQIVGDPVGGIRKHVNDILRGLNEEFDFFYISSQRGDATFYEEIDDISQRIRKHLMLDIVKRPSIRDIINIARIYRFLKANQIDLVHGHGAKGGLYARVAGKLAGCKVVYTPHGGVVHNMFNAFEATIYRYVEKGLCPLTDLLVFESQYTAEAFKRKFTCSGVEKTVNYNGVGPPDVAVGRRDREHLSAPAKVGVFAMLREEKGIRLAFEAAKELLSEGEQLEFHFFGEGELRKTLEQEAHASQMTDKVFFHGEVNHVYQHMMDMDFILIPSLFESFGYVAVESMMAGVPVISSDSGGLKEVLSNEDSFIFESGSTKDMKNAILKATSSSPADLPKMIDKARKRAITLFSLERMCKQLGSLYKQLCFQGKMK